MRLFSLLFYLSFNYFLCVFVLSSGDLTRQKEITTVVVLSGVVGKHHYYQPSDLHFETGKLYKLIIKNKSDSKHYFSSVKFARSIFTRKIQVNIKGGKVSEIKGIIDEVELWPGNELEWWFVPIKTGVFDDLYCRVRDEITEKSHKEMGMVSTIYIK
ncbi:MAG: biphenyl 2,3-dioxygenase [Rickettsiales bacterium]|nr:biphenyl 2,3-dioxygenase [Rickettsiales bacterium]